MSVTDPKFNPSGDLKISTVKQAFQDLESWILDNVPEGRRRSICLTEMETACMYAVKALAVGDE